MDFLRPFASRILASLIAAIAAYLAQRWGITLDADTQAGLLSVTLGIFGVVYGLVHRVLDKSVNPGDAASSHMAVQEKIETAEIKRASAPSQFD